MNRKEFIKKSILLGSLGLISMDAWAESFVSEDFTDDELMGMVRPKLQGEGFNLVAEAATAFESMRTEALKSGIKLYSASSYRSFFQQKGIWNNKYQMYTQQGKTPEQAVQKIMEYSAMPGTSRHHWGTDLDIIDLAVKNTGDALQPAKFGKGGIYNKMYVWMQENASKYGFYEVYTNTTTRTGFKYEPWHYSYKAASQPRVQRLLALDLSEKLQDCELMGKEVLTKSFLETYKTNYIKGINPQLL